jgi:DNA-binding transcriptional MerR regulator/methylmalonyl-CoA mutase cobalamin-binding subunit
MYSQSLTRHEQHPKVRRMTSSITPRFPIRVAAMRAGVTVATLRAWEGRYGAVTPARTAGEQRLYSDDDVQRIALLAALTASGHSISGIADATIDELRRLAQRDAPDAVASAPSPAPHARERDRVLTECMRAVSAHGGDALHQILVREAVRRTPLDFIDTIAAPLSHRIGDAWAAGRLSEAQERVASNAIRNVLGFLLRALGSPAPEKPRHRVLVTTLNGERHENGVLMAGVVAALAGCEVSYAGADLPVPAIATAARRAHADIVALSLIDATAPRVAQRELAALRGALPASVRIAVGGAAAALIDTAFAVAGATRVESLGAWHDLLMGVRR